MAKYTTFLALLFCLFLVAATVTIASTTMGLNMVSVRSINHGVTNIIGQNMLATATHLVTTKNLSMPHGLALIM
ncbi:hypothetical protein MTR67_030259 [Solanum verrucosum]|uniref:Transmembrane protein n=1 Tax=Solanum verrucosum TaxID=315347 RepID=A0AAF0RDU2_SOLVR|nr:hypothetical protein MTR67_030259 [Solanum verrucosum]